MMWPFKRKPKPINPGPINEDWAAGDLAECISAGWCDDNTGLGTIGPELGDVLRVSAITPARTKRSGDGWYLAFATISPREYFQASAFRKVPQLASACDAEFAARIKRIEPTRVQA